MTSRNRAFTLLELLVVISIILVLAGLLMAGAQIARQRARVERSRAVVNVLATACEAYWSFYHDYPYPDLNSVGIRAGTVNTTFGSIAGFAAAAGADAPNIVLVWMLSVPRQPEPLISLNQTWYKKISQSTVKGPDGRLLYRCMDGFDRAINIDRPSQAYQTTYMRITSAGPDGVLGTGPSDPKAKDNIEIYVRR